MGEPGKKIRITEVSLSDSVASLGAIGTATITAQAGNGDEKVLATFESSTLDYKEKTETVNFETDAGQYVILRWYLRTSDPRIRVRIRYCSYTYVLDSLGDPGTSKQKINAYLLIPCATETDANSIKDIIKNKIPEIEIYLKRE